MGEHDGHRSRIIQKLDSGVLLEHEQLEVLLFNALPRRNTNDLAHRLLSAFGTIENIFSASVEQLQKVDGIGASVASYLFCIGKFLQLYRDVDKCNYPPKFTTQSFIPFVKREYSGIHHEVLDVYFLDSDSCVVFRQRFRGNSAVHMTIDIEELSKEIIEQQAAGIVMVHNHPFGKATPSGADDTSTRKAQLICNFHNVLLCDHIIFAPEGVFSYYMSGRLQEISENYSLESVLSE